MKHPRIATTLPQLRAIALAVMLMSPLAASAQPASINSSVKASSAKAAAAGEAKAAAKDNAQSVPGNAGPAVPGSQSPRAAAIDGITSSKSTSKTDPAAAAGSQSKTVPGVADRTAQKPESSQGFAGKPSTIDTSSKTGTNPMSGLTGGSVGGPAGAAASNSGTGSTGVAQQGKGAISAEPPGGPFAGASGTGQTPNDNHESDKSEKSNKTHDDGRGGTVHVVTRNDGSATVTHTRADGSKTVYEKDDKGNVTENGEKVAGMPSEEARFLPDKQQYLDNKLSDRNTQIKQEAKAGSTVNPDRSDTAAGAAVAGAMAPSHANVGQKLFGNPGQAGGVGEGGAPVSGPNFGGNDGAIDPSDEQTVTAGNRQENAADAFGGAPTRDLPSQQCDRDGSTPQTSDDCPKP